MTTEAVRRHLRAERRRRLVIRAASVATVAVVVFVLTVRAGAGDPVLNRRLFVVALGAVALAIAGAWLRWRTEPITVGRPARSRQRGTMLDRLAQVAPPAASPYPSGLRHAEISVVHASRSASGRDRSFRADVRLIAEARVGSDPGYLARYLAPETWQLIRLDRPADESRGPGLSWYEMRQILDDLERL